MEPWLIYVYSYIDEAEVQPLKEIMTAAQPVRLADLAPLTAGMSPPRMSELVLQTAQFDLMRAWYRAVLGLEWSITNEGSLPSSRARFKDSPKQVRASDVRSSFMFLDRSMVYGQVLALFELPELGAEPARDPGLNHIQFRHADLPSLFARVTLLLEHGIEAHRAANHGPMTSFYFCDPDMNVVELCSNNFDTAERLFGFINSDAFRRNPSGVDVDARAFLERYRGGEPLEQLLRVE